MQIISLKDIIKDPELPKIIFTINRVYSNFSHRLYFFKILLTLSISNCSKF